LQSQTFLALRVADKGTGVERKRYTTEQIICKLREAEVDLSILEEASKRNF